MREPRFERDPRVETVSDYVRRTLKAEGIVIPPIHINVVYLRHASYSDGLATRPYVERADVVVPENAGGSHWDVMDAQRTADHWFPLPVNWERARRYKSSEFWEGITDVLHRTKKKVIQIDLPAGSKAMYDFDVTSKRIHDVEYAVLEHIGSRTLHDAAQHAVAAASSYGMAQYKREEYMRSRLGPELVMALRNAKNLHAPTRTEPIVVCIPIGASHRRLGADLMNGGDTVVEDVLFNYTNLNHKITKIKVKDLAYNGRQNEISHTDGLKIVAYAMADYLLAANTVIGKNSTFLRLTKRSFARAAQALADTILPDIESLYKELRLMVGKDMKPKEGFNAFVHQLAEKYGDRMRTEFELGPRNNPDNLYLLLPSK
jgi:hypothetical protein